MGYGTSKQDMALAAAQRITELAERLTSADEAFSVAAPLHPRQRQDVDAIKRHAEDLARWIRQAQAAG